MVEVATRGHRRLVDDVLDHSARQTDPGKAEGDDFREGKITLPAVLAFARGDEAQAINTLAIFEDSPQRRALIDVVEFCIERAYQPRVRITGGGPMSALAPTPAASSRIRPRPPVAQSVEMHLSPARLGFPSKPGLCASAPGRDPQSPRSGPPKKAPQRIQANPPGSPERVDSIGALGVSLSRISEIGSHIADSTAAIGHSLTSLIGADTLIEARGERFRVGRY